VVPTNKVSGSALDQLPHLGALQVLEVIVVRSRKICDHGSVVVGDNDSAPAGRLGLIDTVLDAETGGLDGVVQDGGVLVVTNAAEEDDAVGRQHVLSSAGGILGAASRDEFGGVVVQEVVIDAEVLLFGEDGIIGFEVVFLEQGCVTDCLDI
jgi:hypothetical protein